MLSKTSREVCILFPHLKKKEGRGRCEGFGGREVTQQSWLINSGSEVDKVWAEQCLLETWQIRHNPTNEP